MSASSGSGTAVASFGIITPEAVVLELAPAGLATRALARLLDLLVTALVLVLVLWGLAFAFSGTRWLFVSTMLITLFAAILLAPMLMETFWNGKSIGKFVVGLRIVTLDGGPIQFRHAAVRNILALVDIYAGLGLLPALLTRRSQRFGDLLAGTFVLSDRVADTRAQAILFTPPMGCEAYVGALDVGRLSHRQYSTVRQFLLRVGELSPDARARLGLRLADPLRSITSPAPPAWMTPELFCICVASAYQLRSGTLPPDAVRPRFQVEGPYAQAYPAHPMNVAAPWYPSR